MGLDAKPYLLKFLDRVETPGTCPLYDVTTGERADPNLLSLQRVGQSCFVAIDQRYSVGSPAFLRTAYDKMDQGASGATHLAVGEAIFIGHKRLRRAFPIQAFSAGTKVH